LWVRLNGRVVTLPPPLRNGRIDLWLDPSDGLRRGANALAVGLGANSQPLVRRRFRLTSRLPVAAADDVTTAPGDPVTLDAGAVKDQAGGPLRYQWRLVSGARRLGLPRSGSGRRLVLDPRALVELCTASGSPRPGAAAPPPVSSTLQFVTATVEPRRPLVTIDTDPRRLPAARPASGSAPQLTRPPPRREAKPRRCRSSRWTAGRSPSFATSRSGAPSADSVCGKSIMEKLKGLGNALVMRRRPSRLLISPNTSRACGRSAAQIKRRPQGRDFAAIGVPAWRSAAAGQPEPEPDACALRQPDTWGNWTSHCRRPGRVSTPYPAERSPCRNSIDRRPSRTVGQV